MNEGEGSKEVREDRRKEGKESRKEEEKEKRQGSRETRGCGHTVM